MEHYSVAVSLYCTTHSIKQECILWAFAVSEMKLFVDLLMWWHRDRLFSPTFFHVIIDNSFPFTIYHLIHAVCKLAQNPFSRRGWSILESQGEETGPQRTKFFYAAAFMCFEEIVKMIPWFSWDGGPAFECLVDVSSISPVLFSYRWTELNDYMWRAFFFLTRYILHRLSW